MRVDDVVGNVCLSLPRRSGCRLVSSTSIGTLPPGNGIFDIIFYMVAPAAFRAASIVARPDRRRRRRRRFRRIAVGAQLAPPPAPARAMVQW
jgi:hypothetical protein